VSFHKAEDSVGSFDDLCESVSNPEDIAGNIAIILDKGNCSLVTKALKKKKMRNRLEQLLF